MKWAKTNLGANVPEGTGRYYSWGNLDGHPAGSSYDFSQNVYDNTPGAAITEDLTLSEDAARDSLGFPWRMPTQTDFDELIENCDITWISVNGVYGRLFTSRINGKTIFLPATGEWDGMTLTRRGTVGIYWTSTWYSNSYAHRLLFDETEVNNQFSSSRKLGLQIRPVQDDEPNRSVVPPVPEEDPVESETSLRKKKSSKKKDEDM